MKKLYPVKRPIVVDLFCGAGGLSLGFEQAGFDIALGVDQDGHHIATHERNFPYGKSYCGSVVDLTADSILSLANSSEIDVVIGGPPCQGFSHMGLRDLKDPRNALVSHYMRIVLELRPKAFLMENVPGLLSGSTKKILEDIIELAEMNGYVITKPVKVLDASEFGVPQKRKRLFLLGLRKDVGGCIKYPEGICLGQPQRPTIIEAIGDLPEVEIEERLFVVGSTKYTKRPKSAYAKVARGLDDDPSDLSYPRDWNRNVCTGCLRIKHSPSSVSLYRATPPGQTVPGHKLPRLSPTGIAPTLRAGSDSTHGSYTAPRPIHPLYPRCITAREAARIHGFPDWFEMYPLKWHAYRQIGNAVCPPVGRALGLSIMNALAVRRTQKKPDPVTLVSTFTLPDDRPRTLKRIPVLEEFPPVIRYLFTKAFDESKKQLRKTTFTFKDVKTAIKETGANLHWVRKDTFLQEIARSRSVKKLLMDVHKAGYSIKIKTEGEVIGAFVPLGTIGTLEDKENVNIRIDEIQSATLLHIPPTHLNGDIQTIRAVVSDATVRKALWGNSRLKVVVDDAEDGTSRRDKTNIYSVRFGKSTRSDAMNSVLVVCKSTSAISKTRIARIARLFNCNNVSVVISATEKHFVVIRYGNCISNGQEICRAAFELTGEKGN